MLDRTVLSVLCHLRDMVYLVELILVAHRVCDDSMYQWPAHQRRPSRRRIEPYKKRFRLSIVFYGHVIGGV